MALISVALQDAAVCTATAVSYDSHWKIWTDFVQRMLSEHGFEIGWPELLMLGWDIDMQVSFLQKFYAYCVSEKDFAASSLDSCSSGIKFIIRERGGGVEAFDDPRCKQTRAGAHRLVALARPVESKKLPVSIGIINRMVAWLKLSGSKRDLLIALAVQFAFYSALRANEYIRIGSDAESHVIRAGDVHFGVRGDLVRSWCAACLMRSVKIADVIEERIF
jgi:hypothetical protein